jgi:hypothetical protein
VLALFVVTYIDAFACDSRAWYSFPMRSTRAPVRGRVKPA